MSAAAAAATGAKTYVLLHGAWHGAWCWRDVAASLLAAGHRVFTPTQTGLGERRHLLTKAITLDTFIDDLTGVLEAEELTDAILVGHSFGGIAITGAADRMPERIRHLVYLDSLILEDGQSPFGTLPPAVVAARRAQIAAEGQGVFVPAPPAAAFGIPAEHTGAAWVARRLTPHPAGTYESPLRLAHPVGNGRPATYIVCADPLYAPLEGSRQWVRRAGWPVLELRTGHDAMVTAPTELATMLGSIG